MLCHDKPLTKRSPAMSLSSILGDLDAWDPDNGLDELSTIAERLEEADPEGEAVEPVLRFLEEHRDLDLGMPGPLVHYVERFFRKGYEEKLLASLRRAPTPRTVWMLNRLLNGLTEEEREPYRREMQRLTTADDVEVAALARRWHK